MRLLIVDDEVEIADTIAKGLKLEGFAVDTAYSGEEALDKAVSSDYDLICLDITMPGISGLEVCAQLRGDTSTGHNPRILMLTALDEIHNRVEGLDQGADDYLVKPFDFAELLARVRALLRRDKKALHRKLKLGDLELDFKLHTAAHTNNSQKVKYLKLTSKEFRLLEFFMSHPDEVFSQERLLEHNWDENSDPLTHTVRVTIGTLRKKLREVKSCIEIETVVGEGYKLVQKNAD